ncbi:hypothetical protein FPHOBKDP_00060 [Listeria phage LPJP1]|nr:hypothetical protein FPHOBKDP_00060 [Listeria phage LPJP1]
MEITYETKYKLSKKELDILRNNGYNEYYLWGELVNKASRLTLIKMIQDNLKINIEWIPGKHKIYVTRNTASVFRKHEEVSELEIKVIEVNHIDK